MINLYVFYPFVYPFATFCYNDSIIFKSSSFSNFN